jgi:outer membrane protein OmpA-like peptidoglycan-associated protein
MVMRHLFIAGALLLAAAGGCAGGSPAAKRTELSSSLGLVTAPPVAGTGQAKPVIAPVEAPPEPAGKTADQIATEEQERLATKRRESDAQEMLAANAAVRVDFGGLVITLCDSALFAPEGAALLDSSAPMMKKVVSALLVTKERELIVEGHTDSNGTAGGNIELSRQRAEAVRTYLIAQGYPASRIRAQGMGGDRPVASNGNAKGREKNRRVEIVVSVKKDEAL